jgi:FkbM family methyltransferase
MSRPTLVKHRVGSTLVNVPPSSDLERWQPNWMSDLLRRVLPLTHGVFVDVGVNRMQTFFDLRSVEPKREYIGFEPNPVCLQYAWEVVRQNPNFPSTIIPCALSDMSGVLDLWIHRGADFDSCATTVRDLRPERDLERVVCASATADQILGGLKIGQVGLLKVDVEGGELSVMRGATQLLSTVRPIIVCEVLRRDSKADPLRYRQTIDELFELLSGVQYDVLSIRRSADDSMVMGVHHITSFPDEVWTEQNKNECDYFFCPSERSKALCKLWPGA